MPVGYLISVLLVLLPTALAVAPVRRSWTLGQISWRLGFQISELPAVAAIWLVFWTAFAALEETWRRSAAGPCSAWRY